MDQELGTFYNTRYLYRKVDAVTQLQAVAYSTSSADGVFEEFGVSFAEFTSAVLLRMLHAEHCMFDLFS